MTRQTARWFHDNCGELFTETETPFDRKELVELVNDSVDPVQQISADEERYYGIISYQEHNGWYEYTRWDDTLEEVNMGVCARCVEQATTAEEVGRTLGDDTETALEKFEQHYKQEHTTRPSEVETGAILLDGTTVNGNEAIHPGMDGQGSGVDAEFIQGKEVGVKKDLATVTQELEIEKSFHTPGGGPGGLGLDANESVWVADSLRDSIFEFNQTFDTLSKFSSPSASPEGVSFDSNDSLWLVENSAEKIFELDKNGTQLQAFNSPSSNPQGLGFDENDSLYHQDGDAESLFKLDKSINKLSGGFATPCVNPTGVGVDNNGSLWLNDEAPGVDSIYKFDKSGSELDRYVPPRPNNRGIDFDSNSSIWLVTDVNDRIFKHYNQGHIEF